MRIQPQAFASRCHVSLPSTYGGMKVPRLLQKLLNSSPENFPGVKCLLPDWLVERKALNSIFEEFFGEGTDVENLVEFPVVVDVADVANPKALWIESIFWLGIAQGITKVLYT